MDTARQARRILEAWTLPDYRRFEAELQSALTFCEEETPVSEMENEQQAVLQSVVQRLRQVSQCNEKESVPHQFEAGFFLLRHLRSRTVPTR